jgi:hypothetical protein
MLVLQIILAYCDNSVAMEAALQEAFPDLGRGLPPGHGKKEDAFHVVLRLTRLMVKVHPIYGAMRPFLFATRVVMLACCHHHVVLPGPSCRLLEFGGCASHGPRWLPLCHPAGEAQRSLCECLFQWDPRDTPKLRKLTQALVVQGLSLADAILSKPLSYWGKQGIRRIYLPGAEQARRLRAWYARYSLAAPVKGVLLFGRTKEDVAKFTACFECQVKLALDERLSGESCGVLGGGAFRGLGGRQWRRECGAVRHLGFRGALGVCGGRDGRRRVVGPSTEPVWSRNPRCCPLTHADPPGMDMYLYGPKGQPFSMRGQSGNENANGLVADTRGSAPLAAATAAGVCRAQLFA